MVALLALSIVPAFAGTSAQPVTLTGKEVFSTIEGPHYELLVCSYDYPARIGPSYVLVGSFDFSRYANRTVEVKGYIDNGPNIWGKPVLRVISIRAL